MTTNREMSEFNGGKISSYLIRLLCSVFVADEFLRCHRTESPDEVIYHLRYYYYYYH